MFMKHKLGSLCLLLFLTISANAITNPKGDFDKHFRIMPEPQKVELLNGKGISYNTLQAVYLKGTAVKPVLYGELNHLPYATEPRPGVLALNLTTDKNQWDSTEGYNIEIRNNKVVINASC
jgi:hypothetical protein